MTIVRDEGVRLPKWLRYYRQHIQPSDIYVLDHGSEDLRCIKAAGTCNRVPVANEVGRSKLSRARRDQAFDHSWLRDTVSKFHSFLLCSYDRVIFVEVDEYLVPSPDTTYRNLREFLLYDNSLKIRANGFELLHAEGEPALDWNKPFLDQRQWWANSLLYSKPCVNAVTPMWELGFHKNLDDINQPVLPHLYLVHTHRADLDEVRSRHNRVVNMHWSESDLAAGRGGNSRVVDESDIVAFCRGIKSDFEKLKAVKVPNCMKGAV
jgi:hypothetical protein